MTTPARSPRGVRPARRRHAPHKPRLPARERVGRLTIREMEESGDGYSWKTFMVQGWKEGGRYQRRKFKSREDAEAFVARKGVELMNRDTALHNVLTALTPEQVRESEAAFTRLAGRYPLGDAVDYYLRHFARPDVAKGLDDARAEFLEARERDGTRARSLLQLDSTLRHFIAFVTLERLPAELKPDAERVRLELEAERMASVREIVRRVAPEIRPAVASAAAGVEGVPALLAALPRALRDRVADARDLIEAARRPGVRDIARAVVERLAGARWPDVHEMGLGDVEGFLRSLRAKDGQGPASRKSWNNGRADLHAFFAWAAGEKKGRKISGAARLISENPAAAVAKHRLGRGLPEVLTVDQSREVLHYAAAHEGGALAKYFALALFAGLRTGPDGELHKLAGQPDRAKWIDLPRGVIHVQPEISKTHQYRQVTIRPALHAWLTRFSGEIWPRNGDRMLKHVRARFALGHDVLRHTFFSFLVAAEGSVERAALEGGNTESILRRHYLNLSTVGEAGGFWKILPPATGRKNVVQMRA